MYSKNPQIRQNLIDGTRMQEVAIAAGRSAEALFGYLSRLDALREADLDREALGIVLPKPSCTPAWC